MHPQARYRYFIISYYRWIFHKCLYILVILFIYPLSAILINWVSPAPLADIRLPDTAGKNVSMALSSSSAINPENHTIILTCILPRKSNSSRTCSDVIPMPVLLSFESNSCSADTNALSLAFTTSLKSRALFYLTTII